MIHPVYFIPYIYDTSLFFYIIKVFINVLLLMSWKFKLEIYFLLKIYFKKCVRVCVCVSGVCARARASLAKFMYIFFIKWYITYLNISILFDKIIIRIKIRIRISYGKLINQLYNYIVLDKFSAFYAKWNLIAIFSFLIAKVYKLLLIVL